MGGGGLSGGREGVAGVYFTDMKNYTSTEKTKVGVVGYGGAFNMGRQHLQQMKDAGMTPLAVAEVNAERLVLAKEDFPGIET